ncbi:MAG: glycerophosphodiester phosphodiesterase [Clostridia bacterium]|nr:glycerophosphodiester phosphodiesterase [Clostridia bacterium]
MSTPMITAHSGCEGTSDDSIASIETGIALGADCVEVDVRTGKDGSLQLSHDEIGDKTGLITLREAFALVRESGIAVNCDLKEYGALLPVLALAEECGLTREQLIFSGCVDPKFLISHPGAAARSRIFLNSEELVSDLAGNRDLRRAEQAAFLLAHPRPTAERFRRTGAAALNAPYGIMTDDLIGALRAEGIPLSLWTLNDEDVLREYMKKELLNITTRVPSAALRIRGALGK